MARVGEGGEQSMRVSAAAMRERGSACKGGERTRKRVIKRERTRVRGKGAHAKGITRAREGVRGSTRGRGRRKVMYIFKFGRLSSNTRLAVLYQPTQLFRVVHQGYL